jgi:multiple sugar transport system ATP-binding protein
VRQEGKSSYNSGDQLSFAPKGELFHRFDEAGKPMMH